MAQNANKIATNYLPGGNSSLNSLFNHQKSKKLNSNADSVASNKFGGAARELNYFSAGNGSNLKELEKLTNNYLSESHRLSKADVSSAKLTVTELKKLAHNLTNINKGSSLTQTSTEFLSSIKKLTAQPSEAKLQKELLTSAKQLSTVLKNNFLELQKAHTSLTPQLDEVVQESNEYLSKIAELNGKIKNQLSLGEPASPDVTIRKELLEKLTENFKFKEIEKSDGTVDIQIAGSFNLLSGTSFKKLELTDTPKFLVNGNAEKSQTGSKLNFIIYDFSLGAGTGHINLTDRFANNSGKLGALLNLQGQAVIDKKSNQQTAGAYSQLAARIENISRALVNTKETLATPVSTSLDISFGASTTNIVLDSKVNLIPQNLVELQTKAITNNFENIYNISGGIIEHARDFDKHLKSYIASSEVALKIGEANQAISELRKQHLASCDLSQQFQGSNEIQASFKTSISSLNGVMNFLEKVDLSI